MDYWPFTNKQLQRHFKICRPNKFKILELGNWPNTQHEIKNILLPKYKTQCHKSTDNL